MDCKDFLTLIPDFLDDKLNIRNTKRFLEHSEVCEECKEELRIQYLVTEGSIRLEDGDSFDLNKELELKLEMSRKSIKKRRIANIVVYTLEAIGIAAVVFILVLVFSR